MPPPTPCARGSTRGFPSRCSTGSPAPARPRCISRRSRGARRRQAGAGAAARDRAGRAVAGALRGALRRRTRRNGIPSSAQAARARTWRAVARGARAASWSARARRCSCPIADLGLIVVDEEHEAAFKQEDGVIYHARDMAVVRARLGGTCRSCSVSATPSLETVVNIEAGPLRRAAPAGAPRRRDPARRSRRSTCGANRRRASRWLSPALRERGGRDARGRRAGDAVPQPARLRAVDAMPGLRPPPAMPELHRLAGRASPGRAAAMPPLRLTDAAADESARPAGDEDSFAACGPGVERIAEEVDGAFPGARDRVMAPATRSAGRDGAAELRRAHGEQARSTC